ncbi:hypothetical protein BDE02_18G126600 [Populus trichocarpa]|nr:hypothetical protein BDE02_18G126600 [Populus trichocarpa]
MFSSLNKCLPANIINTSVIKWTHSLSLIH